MSRWNTKIRLNLNVLIGNDLIRYFIKSVLVLVLILLYLFVNWHSHTSIFFKIYFVIKGIDYGFAFVNTMLLALLFAPSVTDLLANG